MGGWANAAAESGTTTTVWRKRFKVLAVSTRQGCILRNSDSCIGSRFTHQISPRCGVMALGTPQSCRQTLAKPQSRLPARDRHSLLDRLAQGRIHAARAPVQGVEQWSPSAPGSVQARESEMQADRA